MFYLNMVLACTVEQNVFQADDISKLTNQELNDENVSAQTMDGSVTGSLVHRSAIAVSEGGEDLPCLRQD